MSKIEIFIPPEKWDNQKECSLGCSPVRLFFGGTIDNGSSEDWQNELTKKLDIINSSRDVYIYNPRREDWPSSDEKKEISRQINWELFHLEKSDLIVMNLLENSKSPISLMEIGLFASRGKLMVFCPKGFYRYDNVRIVCERYDIPLYATNNIDFIAEKVIEYVNA